MGAPSSGLIAEFFLQHIEHTQLPHLAHKHKIINYCRYVDDVFLVFDSTHTNIHEILKDFNGLHHKVQFMAEAEKDHTLNYLDITTHRTPHKH
jgi:UDP-N-acetylmuramoylalanine-D-glutamate ligase